MSMAKTTTVFACCSSFHHRTNTVNAPAARTMATPAANGVALDALENLKPPPGVVLPPHDIRNILEKTAGYVARNGAVFEGRIRDKESQNPKFSFLNSSDAYFPFYQWRLSEINAGRGTDVAAGRAGAAPQEPAKPAGPPVPPEFEYSAKMPRINQKDLDCLKLTALFTAKHGRTWMTQLAQRETGNAQFQFLIPNHTFHNFFQHMVTQYSKILKYHEDPRQNAELLAEVQETMQNPQRILERARQRAEYVKFQESEKRKQAEEEEETAAEFARIDWGDFVIVETITFTEADESANLPPPTSLSELQYASLEDRKNVSISANLRIEEAMPGEDIPVQGSGGAVVVPHSLPHAVGPMAPQAPHGAYQPAPRSAQEEEEARRIQERADAQARMQQAQADARAGVAPMKIRENYVPRAAQRAANKQGTQTALCPNCGQQIPINELDEHMRIELLDPRWKEQKSRAESRYAHSNISHADVANNLKRLASQRSDVFDPVTGQAISEDELARRKKAAMNSFDGNPEGKSQAHMSQLQNFNVEEQIRAIHQKFSGEKK
ncbi:Surp module family protein [Drechmeria coniospora]|uniref:Surp module family protein n=1 Tax=Drechmeria coniospora TaxID=98403 RepID=A0A151GIT8_DRECN|nr:Surp module family protein [Drechmeria coniospora]KYK57006.1 Surp module family protein [Drechmeria coniospora]